MKVEDKVDLGNGHFIEFGWSSWNETERSVRNRYPTSTGGFSLRSSSEVSLQDFEHMIREIARRDLLEPRIAARLVEFLAGSIARQTNE